jgi:phage terminase large subunit-like protein
VAHVDDCRDGRTADDDERTIVTKLTGRERELLRRVEELICVVGRRGGKSRAMAVLAVYIAALSEHKLVRGERSVVLCIARDQRQAAITLDYCEAAIDGSPV